MSRDWEDEGDSEVPRLATVWSSKWSQSWRGQERKEHCWLWGPWQELFLGRYKRLPSQGTEAGRSRGEVTPPLSPHLQCPASASYWGHPLWHQLGGRLVVQDAEVSLWVVVCKWRPLCTITNYFAMSSFCLFFILVGVILENFEKCYKCRKTSISHLKKNSTVSHIYLCKSFLSFRWHISLWSHISFVLFSHFPNTLVYIIVLWGTWNREGHAIFQIGEF